MVYALHTSPGPAVTRFRVRTDVKVNHRSTVCTAAVQKSAYPVHTDAALPGHHALSHTRTHTNNAPAQNKYRDPKFGASLASVLGSGQ